MNIRLRSAQSRREAVRTGLISYLGAGIERNAAAAEDSDPPTGAPTAEHLPAIGAPNASPQPEPPK